jgi:hypothetical protein
MTAMPIDAFFDEEGRKHFHNPNNVTQSYRCSNGHSDGAGTIGSVGVVMPPKSDPPA